MTHPVSDAVAALISRFRRQRPLRAGSLLVTLFGDSIAPRGGAISLGSLIALATPFGVNERLVRTSMARLAADGWLETQRRGRLSEYRLSADGRERFAAATQQIYAVPGQPWRRRWTLVLVASTNAKQREATQRALHWAGFGEAIPGVFAHPTLSAEETERVLRRARIATDAIVLTTGDGAMDSHVRLATISWNLTDLAHRYRRFILHFEPALVAFGADATASPLHCFLLRGLLIHEYRKVHLRDPLLPADLLPANWAGADAYRLCRALYQRAVPLAEQYLSGHAVTLNGPLPPANSELHGRFGGVVV